MKLHALNIFATNMKPVACTINQFSVALRVLSHMVFGSVLIVNALFYTAVWPHIVSGYRVTFEPMDDSCQQRSTYTKILKNVRNYAAKHAMLSNMPIIHGGSYIIILMAIHFQDHLSLLLSANNTDVELLPLYGCSYTLNVSTE